MKIVSFAVLVLTATPAMAQQQPTPSQLAIQIDGVINGWAQTIENDQHVIAELRKQIEDLKAQNTAPVKDKK